MCCLFVCLFVCDAVIGLQLIATLLNGIGYHDWKAKPYVSEVRQFQVLDFVLFVYGWQGHIELSLSTAILGFKSVEDEFNDLLSSLVFGVDL